MFALASLEELSLRGTRPVVSVDGIHELPRLRVLDLSETTAGTACMCALGECKSLVSLLMRLCMCEPDYSGLVNITTLEELDMNGSCNCEACVRTLATAAPSRSARPRNVYVHSRRTSGSMLHATPDASRPTLCLSACCRVSENEGTR
ncbi:hypothetical protein TRVL_05933 [Trypanosoma vivax]|nr:hypothetical protein TRVL_05933 [Trypanosoma vivax]